MLDIATLSSSKRRFFQASLGGIACVVLQAVIIAGMMTYGRAYSYYGFSIEPDRMKILFAAGACLIVGMFAGTRPNLPSAKAFWMLVIFWFTPTMAYFGVSDDSWRFASSVVLAMAAMCLTFTMTPVFGFKRLPEGRRIATAIIATMACGSVVIILLLNGLPSLAALNLYDVYSVRRGYVSNPALEYLQSWTIYVISPYLIGLGFQQRRWRLIAVGCGINLFSFLCSGAKYSLFIVMVSLFVAWKSRSAWYGVILASGVAFAAAFAVAAKAWLGIDSLFHLFLVRPLFIPSWLSFVYHTFFSDAPLLYFSEMFPSFIESPYPTSSEIMIGDYLYQETEGSWVTGNWTANAYANLGWGGPAVFGLILGGVLRIADSIWRAGANLGFVAAFTITAHHIAHTSMFTVFASRGLFFALLLGWLMCEAGRRKRERPSEEASPIDADPANRTAGPMIAAGISKLRRNRAPNPK